MSQIRDPAQSLTPDVWKMFALPFDSEPMKSMRVGYQFYARYGARCFRKKAVRRMWTPGIHSNETGSSKPQYALNPSHLCIIQTHLSPRSFSFWATEQVARALSPCRRLVHGALRTFSIVMECLLTRCELRDQMRSPPCQGLGRRSQQDSGASPPRRSSASGPAHISGSQSVGHIPLRLPESSSGDHGDRTTPCHQQHVLCLFG